MGYTYNLTLLKDVTKYNEESKDWSGEHFTVFCEQTTKATKEDVKTWAESYGLDFDKFNKREEELNRFDYCQTENGDGYEDENGLYLADYVLIVEVLQTTTLNFEEV